MELKRLKARLATAVRGHKLLKDKSDEMIRQFTIIIREDKRLRDEVEAELVQTLKEFSIARSVTPAYEVETAFAMPTTSVLLDCQEGTVMGVPVPKISMTEKGKGQLPYAYAEMTSEADVSVEKIATLLPKLVELAQTEKAVTLLAAEIERNKRRVNALEYVMIPQLQETIKYIKSKLDENERAAVVRIMKVKNKAQ